MRHLIRRQSLEVELNGAESEAMLLTRVLSDWCEHTLAPALEKSFDRCAPPDRNLYIERLEIDAGALTLENLERDLVESVIRAIEKAISEQLPSENMPQPGPITGSIRSRTTRQAIDEALIFFLKTGRLPWSFNLPEGLNLEQVVLDSWQEAEKSGAPLRPVIEAISSAFGAATVRSRLIRQFSPKFLEKLLSLVSPAGAKTLAEVFQILRGHDLPVVEVKEFERRLWETAFISVVAGDAVTARSLISETYRALFAPPPPDSRLTVLLENNWPGVTEKVAHQSDVAEQITSKAHGSEHVKISELGITPAEAGEPMEVREGIYVENAGLVLLHPFLPRFFAALGVADEERLLKPERALCLLHYLATGQPAAPEYELTLPKILCAVPLEMPVESNVELTAEEKEEAAALLEAVIGHWEVLRNTSPDGLRGAFLMRLGKLSLREDGDWLLQVESKSLDILMQQLPWGISAIKLPWMPRMLWVEWSQ